MARHRLAPVFVSALVVLAGTTLTPARSYAQTAPASPTQAAPQEEQERDGIETHLARLRTESADVRTQAAEALEHLEPSDVPAIRQRLLAPLGVSHFNVHAAMVRAIRSVTGGRENADFDLLTALIAYPSRTQDIDLATERIALARALGAIKTADSGRALVAFGLAHNRIFRLATIRIARNQLKEYTVPALIEIRRPTDDMRLYIRQMREGIRRVTPGESVQTRDNALLAEVIRAYGSVRQQDAMAVVGSFVNSDRVQVREAARWAIAQFGRDAINVLRSSYENFVGEDPNPLWGWERVARELYSANDRRKTEEVAAAMDQGLAAARAGRNDEMLSKFEWVLSRHPLFERRGEMVEHLERFARSLERTDVARAAVLYRTALRIDPEGARANALRGAILYLDAERALSHGVADPELYRAALTADPTHARARAQFDAVAQVEVLRSRYRRRAIGAGGLVVVALAFAGLIASEARRRARKRGLAKKTSRVARAAAASASLSAETPIATASQTDTSDALPASIASIPSIASGPPPVADEPRKSELEERFATALVTAVSEVPELPAEGEEPAAPVAVVSTVPAPLVIETPAKSAKVTAPATSPGVLLAEVPAATASSTSESDAREFEDDEDNADDAAPASVPATAERTLDEAPSGARSTRALPTKKSLTENLAEFLVDVAEGGTRRAARRRRR
ncbi:MAG: hypothetical protein Q8Q09_26540 [Deltaproteobacteria bacterium]|nr:hypothetical protein [Deltaproteobacteria bacterium]